MVSPRPVDQFPSFESKFALGRLFGQEFQPASGQLKEVFHDLVAFNGPRCFAIQVVHQRGPSPVGFVGRERERERLANLRADHFHRETFHERLIGGEGNLQVVWTGDDETHNVLGVGGKPWGHPNGTPSPGGTKPSDFRLAPQSIQKFHHPVPVLWCFRGIGQVGTELAHRGDAESIFPWLALFCHDRTLYDALSIPCTKIQDSCGQPECVFDLTSHTKGDSCDGTQAHPAWSRLRRYSGFHDNTHCAFG